jgi:hypothetical protein
LKALLLNWRSEITAPAWWNGRMTSVGGWSAPVDVRLGGGRQALDSRGVPGSARQPPQHAERHALGDQRPLAAGRHGVAQRLQLGGHLPRQHLDVTRPEHAERGAAVGDRVEVGHRAALVVGGHGGKRIVAVEVGEVEALRQHEDVGDDVAAAAGDAERGVVAAGAGVGVGPGNAVEVAREDQRLMQVAQLRAGPLGERPAGALLGGPVGGEQPLAVLDERQHADARFLAVLQVPRHRDFTADLGGPHRGGDARRQQPGSEPPLAEHRPPPTSL